MHDAIFTVCGLPGPYKIVSLFLSVLLFITESPPRVKRTLVLVAGKNRWQGDLLWNEGFCWRPDAGPVSSIDAHAPVKHLPGRQVLGHAVERIGRGAVDE